MWEKLFMFFFGTILARDFEHSVFFVQAHPHYEIPPTLYCQNFSFAPVYMGEALHKCIYMLVWWPTVLNNTSTLSPKLETPFRYAFWPEGNWKEFRYKPLDELIHLKQNYKRFIQLAPFLPHTPDKNKRLPQWIWKDIKVMFTFSYFLSSFFDIHARKNWKRQNIHNDLELPLSKVG